MTDADLPIEISVQVEEGAWDRLEEVEGLAATAIRAAFEVLPTTPFLADQEAELSLYLTDDPTSQGLNHAHRGKDKPTNVLSFPQAQPPAPVPWIVGDIVLAAETVAREAEDRKISLSAHTCHLIVHGFLHLLGYDHQIDTDAAEMESLEIAAMAVLGYENPYETAVF